MKPIQTPAPVHHALSFAALVAVAALAQAPAHAQTAASSPAGASVVMTGPMGAGSGASGTGAHDMQRSMMSGMERMQQMKMTGDADKDFAAMMKMHHQQAVEMAQAELRHGKSPELQAMARKMIRDQTKEIAQLDAWTRKHP